MIMNSWDYFYSGLYLLILQILSLSIYVLVSPNHYFHLGDTGIFSRFLPHIFSISTGTGFSYVSYL